MSYFRVPFRCSALLDACTSLDTPILFWNGDAQQAVLCVKPVRRVICESAEDVATFVREFGRDAGGIVGEIFDLPSGRAQLAPTNGDSVDGSLWSRFQSGWAGYFAYAGSPLAEFYEYPLTLLLDLASDECWLNNPRELGDEAVQAFLDYVGSCLGQGGDTEVAPYGQDRDIARGDIVGDSANPYGQDRDIAGGNIVGETFGLPNGRAQLAPTNGEDPLVKPKDDGSNAPTSWQPAWSFSQYELAFNQVMSYLKAGDCYQVNLAMPFYHRGNLTELAPLPLLSSFNPAFGGYVKTSHASLFSVSPERFIAVQGNHLETRPIKGTVARGQNAAEDEANKAWLANSSKNQSENLMIVDLLRNDLSLFAQPHSVKVDKLFAIETHANVHHMVSTISALKREDVSALQVIHAAFPGGSITGAPKKRAMEVIAELEADERGPYCGSLGFIDDAGFADFNILIRTVVARENGAQCWAGGGLVMDSQCEEEWQELHTKVNKILREFD